MIDQVSLALIRLALQEDLAGFGDVTTEFTVPAGAGARGTIGARHELVASGLPLAAAVLREVDPRRRLRLGGAGRCDRGCRNASWRRSRAPPAAC